VIIQVADDLVEISSSPRSFIGDL